MKPFFLGILLTIAMVIGILITEPHTWFYHGMKCSGGIGGGCDTTTATGGIMGWINK
tara:strand:+ start:440 stop:610 length:171 start_codon:yes stop_codon:yes gene_type:complete